MTKVVVFSALVAVFAFAVAAAASVVGPPKVESNIIVKQLDNGNKHSIPSYQLTPEKGIPSSSLWTLPVKPEAAAVPAPPSGALAIPYPGQVMRVRVLVVVYTNTAGGTITPTQITKLQNEVEQARMFYWRNSHCRCYLDVTYEIIDEYKPITDFWEVWENAYWMHYGPVETDLRERGYVNNQFSGVVNFYAWGENGYGAAFGGGAYGVYAILGCGAYCAIPHCWDPNTNDWFFLHEFHHELDSMFHYSGFPEYPHADLPIELPGDFGEGYDFNAFIMRTWPVSKWMSLAAPWGNIISVTDADLDGLPDSGSSFPLTETIFNSNTSLVDTDSDGLDDLGEAMGGIMRSCVPFDSDTDNDGLIDGLDKYPIYAIKEHTPKGTRTINGNIEASWHLLGSPMGIPYPHFTTSIRTNWDPNKLYLAFQTNQPSRIRIYLDADNDGWFHGKDNYEITINPQENLIENAHILDCSPEAVSQYGGAIWDDDSRYTQGRIVVPSDIQLGCAPSGFGFVIEAAIPRNTTSKLLPQHGDKIGLRVVYSDISWDGSKWASAFEQDVFVDLVLLDGDSWTSEMKVAGAKAREDGQWVDLVGGVVSAVYLDGFYVQDEDRASGIKIASNADVAEGDRLRIIGRLTTAAGERVLEDAIIEKLPFAAPP